LEDKNFIMDAETVRAILPHRYPFLLVDRILELEPGKRAVGLKNVTMNEQFFNGHFPTRAIMPGVLVLESMAQVGGVMMLALPDRHSKLALIAGLDKTRFRKPVLPGDTLISEVQLVWFRHNVGRVQAYARVNGHVVAEAEMTFALVDHNQDISGVSTAVKE
jgi:3-hydroxyacyl-[acyl-carrier-protein] dehydratase